MEKLRDLSDRVCSFENLLGAYREAAKDKRYRAEVIQFSLNLTENLLALKDELISKTYKISRYREFYVRYPKPRLVMAIPFRDRVVQHAIYRQINPYIDKRYVTHSYGCRKGKGTLAAAQCLLRWVQKYSRKPDAADYVIVKDDISKYFYRVSHRKILDAFCEITDDEWFFWLIKTIIDNPETPFGLPRGAGIDDCPKEMRLYDVGMPIGNLTSQMTANLYLHALDKYCKHTLRIKPYVRYVDDFIMIARKEEAAKIQAGISTFLIDELTLDLSHKSQVVPLLQGCEFVGYVVTPHGLRLRKKTTRHAKRAMKKVSEEYADGEISLGKAMETVNSYFGRTEHCNGYNLRVWMAENIVFQRREVQETGKQQFYRVAPLDERTADVYLFPNGSGADELRVLRGVEARDGLIEDIRARFYDWCESAEPIKPGGENEY